VIRGLGWFVAGGVCAGVVVGGAGAGRWAWARWHPEAHPVVWTDPVPGARPVGVPVDGPLTGLVVYLSAGHGYLLHRVNHDGDPISFGRQRDRSYGMVEDEWTAQFVADWLAPELEARGATVLALRERDRNPEATVSEDGGPGFAATGVLGVVPQPGASAGQQTRLLPGGRAVWRLTVPETGHWYLYGQWGQAPDQDPRATFTTTVGDQGREVVVDQREHGGHWWPLFDGCVEGGTEVEVVLSGSGEGRVAADAVRLGGGTTHLVLPWSLEVRSLPYFEVAMAHQLERLGDPANLAQYECGATVSDMRLRSWWSSAVHPRDEEAAYLSIHTNASPVGRARGLTVFYGVDSTPPTSTDPESRRLAALLEDGVYTSVHANDPAYETRGTRMGDYSEVSPIHNTLPAVLLEMGFHDDAVDAARLQTAAFQRDAAAGIALGLEAWRAGAPGGEDLPLGPRGARPARGETEPWTPRE
jgi:N-acetylmuramoyl-L-alanine amidase